MAVFQRKIEADGLIKSEEFSANAESPPKALKARQNARLQKEVHLQFPSVTILRPQTVIIGLPLHR